MAEETKKTDTKKLPAILIKVILGLAFLGLGAWAILKWWEFVLMIIKGCIGLSLLLAGIITLAIAKE